MNDFARRYGKQETADIYRASKIVVNVSREDSRKKRTCAVTRRWLEGLF